MRSFYSREEIAQIGSLIVGDLLPGRSKQDPYVESAVQNYKMGSRLATPDGLVWHYGRADAVGITAAYRRRIAVSTVVAQNFKVLAVAANGAKQIIINDTASAAVHPEDYWAGGHASIFPLPGYSNDQPRMIKSSSAGNGTSVTLTLYYPIHYALAIDDDVYCCPSPYAAVREAVSAVNKGFNTAIGYSWMAVTPLYYVWLQTWGLCQPVYTNTDQGLVAGSRDIYINYNDGTTVPGDKTTFAATQRIGTLAPLTYTPGGDEAYVNLQLDP